MTCIGNSGPLPEPVVEAITQVSERSLGVFRAVVSFHMTWDQNAGKNSWEAEMWLDVWSLE